MKYSYECSKCKSKEVYKPRKDLPKDPHTKCSQCGFENHFKDGDLEELKGEKAQTKKQKSIPPQNTTGSIAEKLNEPVKFVQTIIVDELVRTRDVRWAQLFVSILDKTNKLDFNSIREQEWSNQAKHMSMKELVERVAKKDSISRSTLRRLDSLEDTSPYENI